MSRFTMLIVLSFLWGVPAFAQFEINPDHFDAEAQKPPRQQAKAKAKITPVNKAARSMAAARADQGKKGQTTWISSQQPDVGSLQPASATAGKTPNSAASTSSTRRRLRKTKTVSSLQLAQGSVA